MQSKPLDSRTVEHLLARDRTDLLKSQLEFLYRNSLVSSRAFPQVDFVRGQLTSEAGLVLNFTLIFSWAGLDMVSLMCLSGQEGKQALVHIRSSSRNFSMVSDRLIHFR